MKHVEDLRHRNSDYVFCRHGGNKSKRERDGMAMRVVATGERGTPAELEPDADIARLEDLAKESARIIAVSAIAA